MVRGIARSKLMEYSYPDLAALSQQGATSTESGHKQQR
jgi:hypothetical protein